MKTVTTVNKIQNQIYTIRDTQVMLDRDLAVLYEVKAIRLREQVKRNRKRFPDDFIFKLTEDEVDIMVSQNAIPSKKHLGGSLPYVFTEQGVAGLSSVLTSKKAIEINIQIIRAFVKMRKFLTINAGVFQRFENIEQKQFKTDKTIQKIFKALEDKSLKPKQGIFYDGQIFDAYVFVADLIKSAKKSIVLIDNFIDESVLQLFSKRKSKVKVTIHTKNLTPSLKLDLKKFNSQYENISIQVLKDSHDRFLIVDHKELYHIGASLKDLGKKWFAFSRMDGLVGEILGKIKPEL
ncbi:ORF6N domain-containing protein [Patescibacteria group bacterium]|nr:ORF6N domain-containing protein [Patescibacteria group bacterium]MBU1885855.1 ORF6N domain-containing protein [Patescibacteria group bacterium]